MTDLLRRFTGIKLAHIMLICGLAGFFVNISAFWSGFVWDDVVVQSEVLLGKHDNEFINDTRWVFRPVTTAIVFAQAKINNAMLGEVPEHDIRGILAQKRAVLYHATSLLVHSLACALVAAFVFLSLKGRDKALPGALLGGLVFAVHPVHVENTIWISALADSLATLFLLASLLGFHKGLTENKPAILAASCAGFFVAALCKETAITGAALIPLFLWFKGEHKATNFWRAIAALGATALGYLAIRASNAPLTDGSGSLLNLNIPDALRSYSAYFGKLFFPWPPTPYMVTLPEFSFFAVAFIFAAALAIYFYRKEKIYLFCLAWFALALSPTLMLLINTFTATKMAERYLYLPSVSFALFAGFLATQAGWLVYLAAVIVTTFGIGSAVNARVWNSNVSLWTHVISVNGLSDLPTPWLNLGYGYFWNGELASAESSIVNAQTKVKPDDIVLKVKLLKTLALINTEHGENQYRLKNIPKSLEFYRKALSYHVEVLQMEQGDPKELMDAGIVSAVVATMTKDLTGRPDPQALAMAIRVFEEALALSPNDPQIVKNLNRLKKY